MKRATLERLAAVLVLGACICAECIPLLLVLVAAAGLCVGLANSQAIANLSRKKTAGAATPSGLKEKEKLIRPYFRGLEGDCQV
jgi:hypothetical protein